MDLELTVPQEARPLASSAAAFDVAVTFARLPNDTIERIRELPSYWINEAVSIARPLPAAASRQLDEALFDSCLRRIGPLVGLRSGETDPKLPLVLKPFFGTDPTARSKSPNRAFVNIGESLVELQVAHPRAPTSAVDGGEFGAIRSLLLEPGAGAIVPVAVIGYRFATAGRVCELQGYFSA